MAQDVLGNEVGNGAAATLGAIDDFVAGFLANEARAANILRAAEVDHSSPLALTYAGIVARFGDTPQAGANAKIWLERANAVVETADERTRLTMGVLAAWIDNDMPKALALAEDIVDAFPTDLVAVKLHQTFNFNLGNAPDMLRMAKKALPANRDNPHLLGLLAFGYEQCHFIDRAEAVAREALAIKFNEPWCQHALAHVMLTQGRVPEGVAFMKEASKTWVGLNSFMYTHNWWHMALFHISTGNFEAVFACYDQHCWGVDKTYSEDQIGAVSLLTRMELAGMNVGDRWGDVADHLATRAADVLMPFTSLQYLYGLARAERPESQQLLAAILARAATASPFEQFAWQGVAVPAARGLMAHAEGRFETAVTELSLAMPRMMEIGGSHAQRDLFAQILLDAHLKAGHFVTAQNMLEGRRRYDPNGVPLNRMLATVYDKLGLLDEADEARQRHYT